MKSTAVSITTTPTLIIAADDKNRSIYIHNAGGAKIYIGGSDVSTSSGYHLGNGESQELFLPIRETIYAVVASGTNQIQVLAPDGD